MPDHPSWPAELVEKAAAELLAHRSKRPTPEERDEAERITRVVLSALSGDLVPREEVVARLNEVVYGDRTLGGSYEEMILHVAGVETARKLEAEEVDALKEWVDEARSQADALAEALDYLIARCEREWGDQEQPPELDFVMLAVQEVKPRLASYRNTASGEGRDDG